MAVQVEDFGLPKSAVGTAGQTSKICLILTLYFQAVQVEDFGLCSEQCSALWFRTGTSLEILGLVWKIYSRTGSALARVRVWHNDISAMWEQHGNRTGT